eukprot:TRINITY_DN10082_c0_g1_i1.p1 TRINITY_DN10082_c0_g1~~TRINITY_DN10082_c0_g1_i1.p1  ORF type:complete len:400 (+),score=116.34 TRINITY_DN10082_c0_g1_i1:158-1201(+)
MDPSFAAAMSSIFETAGAFYRSKCLHLAVKHRVPDLIAAGSLTADEIAAASGTRAQELRRVLRFLVQVGFFTEDADGKFANNANSTLLQRSHPASLAPLLLHWVGEVMPATVALDETLISGGSAFERAFGEPIFDWYTKHPENEKNFSLVMSGANALTLQGVLATRDWASDGATKYVDVGGNRGSLLQGLLTANPQASGVLFDLPSVVEIARREEAAFQPSGALHSRVEFVGGDFFSAVPAGDVYLLRMILHDWSDEDSIRILKTVRKAIGPTGTVYLVEQEVYGTGQIQDDPMHSLSIDITMLSVFGSARERTRDEFASIFKASGFELKSVTRFSPTFAFWVAVPV